MNAATGVRVVMRTVLVLLVSTGAQVAGGLGWTPRHRQHAEPDTKKHPQRFADIEPDLPRLSLWRRLRALDERINDCWIGDLLGIASLVALVVCTPVLLPMFIIIFGGTP